MRTYPHMCRDGHEEIGFSGDDELCPICRLGFTQEDVTDCLAAGGDYGEDAERYRDFRARKERLRLLADKIRRLNPTV